MTRRRRGARFWAGLALVAVFAIAVAALFIWRDDILEALLNPKIPYTVYRPPPAPDYGLAYAWARLPLDRIDPVDVFFIHPTTYDGGRDWNGPIGDPKAAARFTREIAPNYAAPFDLVGRVFAPRYRQASLYTSLSLFDDAVEARQFAYADVQRAFAYFLDHFSDGRPFILVGVEQGGVIAERLLTEMVAPDPDLRRRLVAAYLQETAAPADQFRPSSPVPACAARQQSGCVVAWISVRRGDLPKLLRISRRSLTWTKGGRLESLEGRPLLCVNPLFGFATDRYAPPRMNLGAASATGLEWGARPGYMARQVDAQCVDGILRMGRPRSASLLPVGGWADRLRIASYNLFYADVAADAQARTRAWLSLNRPAPDHDQPASRTAPEAAGLPRREH